MPRFLNSFDIVSDKGDEVLSHSSMTLPLVKLQMNLRTFTIACREARSLLDILNSTFSGNGRTHLVNIQTNAFYLRRIQWKPHPLSVQSAHGQTTNFASVQ